MYDFNNENSQNKKSHNNLKYMMIKNDNYEDSKSNHIAGFIITLLIIALIVIIKWLLG
ncbi:conserved hypothetical protein [Staphylococcus capitis]|nr:conserved hypothetical protein [Staphylococcus capitis CR01]CQD28130.1 conserved hypothetical protein [Staphylococcus capitis]CQD28417.1 conserved hypothetical protein [Staphylococcus capitis]CQD32091.1 conserved hypothetical protein [Staphylococcus capitis]CRN11773.1 conserved hypothetical protein [Staphylococcus capitis]